MTRWLEASLEIGDIVYLARAQAPYPAVLQPDTGLVIGFNKKGEGGKDYVHLLINGDIIVTLRFNVERINKKRKRK